MNYSFFTRGSLYFFLYQSTYELFLLRPNPCYDLVSYLCFAFLCSLLLIWNIPSFTHCLQVGIRFGNILRLKVKSVGEWDKSVLSFLLQILDYIILIFQTWFEKISKAKEWSLRFIHSPQRYLNHIPLVFFEFLHPTDVFHLICELF